MTNPNLQTNNFYFEPKIHILGRQALGRVDYHFSEKNSAFVRYGYSNNQTNDGAAGAVAAAVLYPDPVAANRNDNMLVQSLAVSDTQIFSPTLFNTILAELHASRSHSRQLALAATGRQSLACPSTGPKAVPQYTLPVVSNGLPNFNGTAATVPTPDRK